MYDIVILAPKDIGCHFTFAIFSGISEEKPAMGPFSGYLHGLRILLHGLHGSKTFCLHGTTNPRSLALAAVVAMEPSPIKPPITASASHRPTDSDEPLSYGPLRLAALAP